MSRTCLTVAPLGLVGVVDAVELLAFFLVLTF